MLDNKLKLPRLPSEFYPDDLLIIKGIKFTPRQIDIIACLINGGTGKTISSLLDIEVKTLEAHKKDIGGKLGGGIQEDIIAFVQNSGQLEIIRQHYSTLCRKSKFEKKLKELSQKKQLKSIVLKYESPQIHIIKPSFFELLISHLQLAGVKVINESKKDSINLSIITKNTLKQLQKNKFEEQGIFLLLDKEIASTSLEEICENGFDYIDFRETQNYFSSCVEVFKKIYSDDDLEECFSLNNPQNNLIFEDHKSSSLTKQSFFNIHLRNFQRQKKRDLGKSLIFLSGIIILPLVFIYQTNFSLAGRKTQENQSIRSELPIPVDEVLLKRPELMEKINKGLQRKKGINTIALVGPGGSGKTTLARQYARSQNLPVVWEINAETKNTLLTSFEKLANVLATTEIDRKKLKQVLDIKDLEEKKNALFLLLKEKLRSYSSWLLIYDNLSHFNDIDKCFPYDSDFWEGGKIIITTTDSNFKDNNFVVSAIDVKELNSDEKSELFAKIVLPGRNKNLDHSLKHNLKKFLENIPPFPLDVSIAAYYIKATNISYDDYLQSLDLFHEDFENFQTNMLNEKTNYKRTRYAIITMSLNHLITIHKDFGEFLLLISLLDSQNILKDILNNYKNRDSYDAFIYYLKKYSLITNESLIDSRQAFSIHRYTQSVILTYLTKKLDLRADKQLLNKISNVLENYIAKTIDEDDFSKMKSLTRHCEKFLNHSDLLTSDIIYSVSGELGGMYFYLGYYLKSKELLEKNLANLGKSNHKDYLAFARTSGYLANVYRDLGNFEKTKELLENSLRIYQKYAPQSHIKLAWILAHLALVNREMGNYETSKNLLEQSLELYKKYLPSNHTRIPWALSILGIVYRELGKYQKAEELLKKSLSVYKQYFSEYHIEVIRALRFLGDVYRDQNNYEAAKNLYEKNLHICKKYHSQDHLDIGYTSLSLAQLYLQKGELEAAEKSLNIALNILQKKKHPGFYKCLEYLAELCLIKATIAFKEGKKELSGTLKKKANVYLTHAKEIIGKHFSSNSAHNKRIETKLKNLNTTI